MRESVFGEGRCVGCSLLSSLGERERARGLNLFTPSIVRGGWWLVVGGGYVVGESSSNDAIL